MSGIHRAARILVLHGPDAPEAVIGGWLVDTFAAHGVLAAARPVDAAGGALTGTLVEVAATPQQLADFTGVLPDRVDLLVSSDLMDAARAARTGLVRADCSAVVTATTRELLPAEAAMLPAARIADADLHDLLEASSWSYVAAAPRDLAGWHDLGAAAVPGVLFGMAIGSGSLDLDPEIGCTVVAATAEHAGAAADPAWVRGLIRGYQLGLGHGQRRGRPPARSLTVTAALRDLAPHLNRDERGSISARLTAVADRFSNDIAGVVLTAYVDVVRAHGTDHAEVVLDAVHEIGRLEEISISNTRHGTVVDDVARSLASILVVRDRAQLARTLLAAHQASAVARRSARRVGVHEARTYLVPSDLIDPPASVADAAAVIPEVVGIRPDRVADAARLRRWAAATDADALAGARRAAREYIDAVAAVLPAVPAHAPVVARSGALVTGWGVARSARLIAARAFWGRVVLQAIAIDDAAHDSSYSVADTLIPACWTAIATHGPIALWEFAAEVVALAMRQSRGTERAEVVTAAGRIAAAS